MTLSTIKLENYRNYQALELKFDSGRNVFAFVGQNAQGKTNLLEAIYTLALGRSFKSVPFSEQILLEEEYGRISGSFGGMDLEVFLGDKPNVKQLKIDGVKKETKEYVGVFNICLFQPEDLNLVLLSPAKRRKYINTINTQVSKKYFEALYTYLKVLKNRNALLDKIREGKSDEKELLFWDLQLVDSASSIIEFRKSLSEFINSNLSNYYTEISHGKEVLELKYKVDTEADNYASVLEKRMKKDIQYGYTSRGPHRDDFLVYLNGKLLSDFGSRGEIRSAIIALKKCEIAYIESITKNKPIILLDDVFSELDKERRRGLLKSFEECQTFITTTDFSHLDGFENLEMFEVKASKVSQKMI